MGFDAATHLRKQGWREGEGLRAGARSRPLPVVANQNSRGLAHGAYDASPWWEDLYNQHATQKPSRKGKERSSDNVEKQGPPTSEKVANNVATARQGAVRKRLYAQFIRGEVVAGSEEANGGAETTAGSDPRATRRREKRRARQARQAASGDGG